MSKDEVIEMLQNGGVLMQVGSLSLQSRFAGGELVSHQVMQSLVYEDLIKPMDARGANARWVLQF